MTPDTAWTCYARPAYRGGQRCGAINAHTAPFCARCGCAYAASEARRTDAETRGAAPSETAPSAAQEPTA